MPVAQPINAANDSPATKKLKTGNEDELAYGSHVALLQSYGTTVCHVPLAEFQKISTLDPVKKCGTLGAIFHIYDYPVETPLVRFLAHWIHHRDSEEAVNAAMEHQIDSINGVLDRKWLDFLVKVLNFCDDKSKFHSDITDSLIDNFFLFLRSGGIDHMDQVFEICKEHCKTHALTSAFANVFLYRKKQFLKQAPTCDYDRAVQRHMHGWLADVWINDRDWRKLPPVYSESIMFDSCFHHAHEKDNDCYVWGRVGNAGYL
ncbi:hypothetical protein KCU95_g12418, partial [Aureobasidium melanogenum]